MSKEKDSGDDDDEWQDVAKWIQEEDKTSKEYNRLFVEGWSQWQPYLALEVSKKKVKDAARLHTQKWLKANGYAAIPKAFGVYAIGVLPPDFKDDAKCDLAANMIIVNHGIAGSKPAVTNTLNGRLMCYATKVKPHEWAFKYWLERGFSVFVKWKKVCEGKNETPAGGGGVASIDGAALRNALETEALSKWKFFLNTSEQAATKGKGKAAEFDAGDLELPAGLLHSKARQYPCESDRTLILECLALLEAPKLTHAQRNANAISFLKKNL